MKNMVFCIKKLIFLLEVYLSLRYLEISEKRLKTPFKSFPNLTSFYFFSKPAIGVLDLATGAATAVRESSRSATKQLPPKMRLPRLVIGPAGSMPIYSSKDAHGQELLHRLSLNHTLMHPNSGLGTHFVENEISPKVLGREQ